jgi:hypothetical protein
VREAHRKISHLMLVIPKGGDDLAQKETGAAF